MENSHPPSYDDNTVNGPPPPHDEEEQLPSYHAAGPSRNTTSQGPTLAIDPTGLFVYEVTPTIGASATAKPGPSGADPNAKPVPPPVYTFSISLLNVKSQTSVHMSRVLSSPAYTAVDSKQQGNITANESSSLPVYALSYGFVSPLHSRNRMLQDIQVGKTHGLLAATKLKETYWDFIVNVPGKQSQATGVGISRASTGTSNSGAGGSTASSSTTSGAATNPPKKDAVQGYDWVYGGPPPGMIQRRLLRHFGGKWVDEHDEVVALDREGGEASQVEGMPMLSIVKREWAGGVDGRGMGTGGEGFQERERMDLLVAAWCVVLWEEIGKRGKGRRGSGQGGGKERKGSLFGIFKGN